jgi:hypothetical protein
MYVRGTPLKLLGTLEAQKANVLTHWADEMYGYIKAIPQNKYYIFHFINNTQYLPELLPNPNKRKGR